MSHAAAGIVVGAPHAARAAGALEESDIGARASQSYGGDQPGESRTNYCD